MDVLEKGLRFQGEAVWWLLRALPPSSQGRDPCSRGGRHTWLPEMPAMAVIWGGRRRKKKEYGSESCPETHLEISPLAPPTSQSANLQAQPQMSSNIL